MVQNNARCKIYPQKYQIPEIRNAWLCPVRALRTLLTSRPLPPTSPLFANKFYPHSQIIDTHVRDALKTILSSLKISLMGHGFHLFWRSGAKLAFDHNVPLQNIMAHGLDLLSKFYPGFFSHSHHLCFCYFLFLLIGLVL